MLHTVMGNSFSVGEFITNEIQVNHNVDDDDTDGDISIGKSKYLLFFCFPNFRIL